MKRVSAGRRVIKLRVNSFYFAKMTAGFSSSSIERSETPASLACVCALRPAGKAARW